MSSIDVYAENKVREIYKILTRGEEIDFQLLPDLSQELKEFIIKTYNDAFDEGVQSVEGYDPEIDRD